MNKIIAVAALAMGLAGCATYSEMAQRSVAYVASTTKTPEAYAECALPKMLDFSAGSHIVHDGVARIIVVPVGGGTPDAVMLTVSAVPSVAATRVELKHMASLSDFHRQWAAAKTCL